MRELIKNIIQDTSKDMREQADRVENAFAKRVEEIAASKANMENQLENVIDEISRQENNIIELKKAIKAKEAPMKVAKTRLNDRSFRPGIELCRDPAHTRFEMTLYLINLWFYKVCRDFCLSLVNEVMEISQSVDALLRKLSEAEENLNKLNDDRMVLEKEIAMKAKSLYTDRDKCLPVRNAYPSVTKLLGHNN